MSLGLCPTKLPVTWEGKADHLPVPASEAAQTCTLKAVVDIFGLQCDSASLPQSAYVRTVLSAIHM